MCGYELGGTEMEQELLAIWQATLDEIEKKMSKPSFETWLKTTRPISLTEDTMVISVPNDFTKDWLQGRYAELIQDTLKDVLKIGRAHV